jgi:hypothetical protein
MAKLKLTNGQMVRVDPDVHKWASQYRWYLKAGYPCRWVSSTFYGAADGYDLYLHHDVVYEGPPPQGLEIHHRDLDPLNARRSNLVQCTRKQHRAFHPWTAERIAARLNRRPRKWRHPECPYKGVTFHKHMRRWTASLPVNGRSLYLGPCETMEDAALRYDAAVLCYRGGVGYLNLIPDDVREQKGA